jgi:hypothetical protein
LFPFLSNIVNDTNKHFRCIFYKLVKRLLGFLNPTFSFIAEKKWNLLDSILLHAQIDPRCFTDVALVRPPARRSQLLCHSAEASLSGFSCKLQGRTCKCDGYRSCRYADLNWSTVRGGVKTHASTSRACCCQERVIDWLLFAGNFTQNWSCRNKTWATSLLQFSQTRIVIRWPGLFFYTKTRISESGNYCFFSMILVPYSDTYLPSPRQGTHAGCTYSTTPDVFSTNCFSSRRMLTHLSQLSTPRGLVVCFRPVHGLRETCYTNHTNLHVLRSLPHAVHLTRGEFQPVSFCFSPEIWWCIRYRWYGTQIFNKTVQVYLKFAPLTWTLMTWEIPMERQH